MMLFDPTLINGGAQGFTGMVFCLPSGSVAISFKIPAECR